MELDASIQLNLKMADVTKAMNNAAERAMRDTVVAIAGAAVQGSPVLTSNNRRSIDYKAEGLSGSIFSTSGYGGYLETGTRFMPARPYMKPALDRNFTEEKFAKRVRENL